MSDWLLEAAGVRKSVKSHDGRLSILNGVDLTVAESEAIAIVGASGSGKTTLLSLLAGLDLPDQGSIRIKSQELGQLDEDQRARLRATETGFVFQSFHLMDDLTAAENVALPLELFGHTNPMETASEWLSKVGLAERARHFPDQLSAGEQQRVALCRAFATEPALLFADEPTANLDNSTAESVIEQLFNQKQAGGAAMVLVTHDESLAERCDRVVHLKDGRLS